MQINGIGIKGAYIPAPGITEKQTTKETTDEEKEIKELSNVSYKPLSFGRTKAEHKSWGASVNPKTKEVSFKILTYPDTKAVTVTVTKRNNPKSTRVYELEKKGEGVFKTTHPIPPAEVSHGDRYHYTLYKGNGDIEDVKDPYSAKQETLLGDSTIYDHSRFEWSDGEWFRNNPNRISRLANSQNGLKSVNDAKIYEFNTATVTKEGTFRAAKKIIDKLPKQGFNAIEIMPVENTYSFNWGYDGVDKFAPSEHLGGPDGLKTLIDYAHSKNLNVIMDMVPNHLGPDGAALGKTGPYLKGPNAFGDAFNFEGENSKYVRDYMINAGLNWLENYHCDGLRLDMTKFMDSDYTMKQFAAEMNFHRPDAFLIAEDGRSDSRVVSELSRDEIGQNEYLHSCSIDKMSGNNADLGRLGFDSEWDFNYYHTLNSALYGNVDLDAIQYLTENSGPRIKYIMSHDEIGNFEGSRLIPKLMVTSLNLNDNVELQEEDEKRANELSKLKNMNEESSLHTVLCQKAQLVSEQLALMLAKGELEKYNTTGCSPKETEKRNNAMYNEVLKPLGIKENASVNYERISNAYESSFSKEKMAMARIYAAPGPVMVFQGDEKADLTPFRFFREFDSVKDENYLYTEKGYQYGRAAFEESKQGTIIYGKEGKRHIKGAQQLTSDLNRISDENPAFTKGRVVAENTVKHPVSRVLATHNRDDESGNETFTITNFLNAKYPGDGTGEYFIKFPEGKWVEILSTDDKKYAGSGEYLNINPVESDGYNNSPIKMNGYQTSIFKKIV